MLAAHDPPGQRVESGRHVTGRDHAGQVGPADPVHQDAVPQLDAGGCQPLDVRDRADPDHDDVGGQRAAVREPHGGDPVRPLQRGDADPGDQRDAVRGMGFGQLAGQPLAQRQGQRHGGQLDQRHLDAEFPRGGGYLGADEAAAGDHQAGAGHQLGAEQVRVVQRAQGVHAAEQGATVPLPRQLAITTPAASTGSPRSTSTA